MAQGTSAAKPAADKNPDSTPATPEVTAPPAPGQGGGTSQGNTAVPGVGDYDRVTMMTLNADGTPKQTPRFEMIGDPEGAKAGTAEQFRQQAVSAEDVRLRGVVAPGGAGETVEQDPKIQELQDAHEKVADAATKAAEAAVDALHTGESEKVPDTNPAATTS